MLGSSNSGIKTSPSGTARRSASLLCRILASRWQAGKNRVDIRDFRDENFNCGMIVKYAGIRCLQSLAVRCMENDLLPESKSGANFDVSSVAARKHHDQYVGVADGLKFILRDFGVMVGSLAILICPREGALPTAGLESI